MSPLNQEAIDQRARALISALQAQGIHKRYAIVQEAFSQLMAEGEPFESRNAITQAVFKLSKDTEPQSTSAPDPPTLMLTVGRLRTLLASIPDHIPIVRRDWFGSPEPYLTDAVVYTGTRVELTPPDIGSEPD